MTLAIVAFAIGSFALSLDSLSFLDLEIVDGDPIIWRTLQTVATIGIGGFFLTITTVIYMNVLSPIKDYLSENIIIEKSE